MKKSIVAMLSITALATVANAGDTFTQPTGTHFEGIQNGAAFYPSNDDAGNTAGPDFFWYAATNGVACEAQFGVYTNADYMGSSYSGDRPATPEATTITDRCLSIDTEGERLIRRMGAAPLGSWSNPDFVQYDVTSAIYFDSLVQFTVNEDEAPTIQTGDKLAVWLQGGETTNLVITAGYLGVVDGADSYVNSTNYVVDAGKDIVPGVWYRLTIEAIPLIPNASSGNGYLGFRVRIDGQEVSTTQGKFTADEIANTFGAFVGVYIAGADASAGTDFSGEALQKLFPSLVQGITHCDTLSCVAFEGTGALDDFVFTTSDPFAGAEPTVPTVDGTDATNAADFLARITTGSENKLPSGWTLDGNQIKDNTGANYGNPIPSFYTPDLADGTLTLVLNTTALPTIGAANVTVGEETEAKEAIEVGDTTFTATLTSTSTKLYYGLKVAASPNAAEWTAGELTQGTGSAMQLTANKPVDGSTVAPAAFFKVYVTDIAPAAPAPAGE